VAFLVLLVYFLPWLHPEWAPVGIKAYKTHHDFDGFIDV